MAEVDINAAVALGAEVNLELESLRSTERAALLMLLLG